MFLLDDRLCWSASDLPMAASCEFSLLRRLDVVLKRADESGVAEDPLTTHIARLGDRHEAGLLEEMRKSRKVAQLAHVPAPYTGDALAAARQLTLDAFNGSSDVVYQATFFDGEFFGYADFIERGDDGWVVCDAKLARSAKPKALLQLAAYADQLATLGVQVSPTVSLLLGNGKRADFASADLLPVFRDRRERLRSVLLAHREGDKTVVWGDEAYTACGSCPECQLAGEDANDLILMAGMRMDQRRKLRAAGVTTMSDLAETDQPPEDMSPGTFAKLRDQAVLQWARCQAGPDAPVTYELCPTAAETLAKLPAPSDGDLFFDFEGDPMYGEGDPGRVGLEYLWGVMDTQEKFLPLWAHDWAEERVAFEQFMDDVAERRSAHPDMHIYHYAPYEKTALKRLAATHQTKENELDDLLRSEVFVDLYATVRGAVRVGAPSYSIKKLEPLYMGSQLRESDVTDGDASVVAYHELRELRGVDDAAADKLLDELQDYNEYDCLSTLRLRDWLLERASEAGVRDQIKTRELDVQGEEDSDQTSLFLQLMERSGAERAHRTPEQQALAMLATGIDYYRRERKQFWWEHFDRLTQHPPELCDQRDVFVVDEVVIVQDWRKPEGRSRNHRRVLRLLGQWGPGSKPASACFALYGHPLPPGAQGPEAAITGWGRVEKIEYDDECVLITESRPPANTFSEVPVALVPDQPPGTKQIEDAIRELASEAAAAVELPSRAALDILALHSPRLRAGASLASTADARVDITESLLAMDDSYLAVQGPPGTGKTFTGSRVIRDLVEKHHWRIGVMAQSHEVVENMLRAIVKAGLAPDLVGKSNNKGALDWTDVTDSATARAAFVAARSDSGCVLGGTAWTFANPAIRGDRELDLLVIDEAGQFALAPTVGASVAAKRLLLLGDPQQLPQVTQGTHAEPINESALGWVMQNDETIPADRGYFLADTYRMHPSLCAKVSTLSYGGRLRSSAPARSLDGIDPGLHVVEVTHQGCSTESPEEAAEVVEQVRAHLGAMWSEPEAVPRPLVARDIVVVAPFNAQVALIRKHLVAAGFVDVRVGTVDKFQGQEAPIAIVSMTASSHDEVPRGIEFVLNRNRINVAVSRAQWRAVLIRSRALTAFMPTSVEGVLELGAFIGLCEDVQPPAPAGSCDDAMEKHDNDGGLSLA